MSEDDERTGFILVECPNCEHMTRIKLQALFYRKGDEVKDVVELRRQTKREYTVPKGNVMTIRKRF